MDRASFEGKSFGDKLASHQQKLPKIPIPGTQPAKDIPETPSPNTYLLNVQRQKSTFMTPLATTQTSVENDNLGQVSKASSISIKPPPKKQKIDMSSFESAPRLERTNSGSVLANLQGPTLLKLETPNTSVISGDNNLLGLTTHQGVIPIVSQNAVSIASVNDLALSQNNQQQLAFVQSQDGGGRLQRQQKFSNPFDMAFKFENSKSVESQNPQETRVVPSVSSGHDKSQNQQDYKTAPLTPLKTSEIPDIVQDLHDTIMQQNQAAQFVQGININGVTYLVQTQKEHTQTQAPLLASPGITSLISGPQNSFVQLAAPSNAQKIPRLVSFGAINGSDGGSRPLLLLNGAPGSAAASFQDVELLAQPQISVKPVIGNMGQNINQTLLNWRPAPSVTVSSSLADVANALKNEPALVSVGGNNVTTQSIVDNVTTAKAKMREQLERKLHSSNGTHQLQQMQVKTTSSAFLKENTNTQLGSQVPLQLNNPPPTLPSGSNSVADSTTRLEETEPKYSLTREKNREAAQRCREKRKKWIANIQDENKRLNTENSRLKEQVAVLQHELMDLKTRLLNEHSSLLSGSASKLSLPAVSLRSEFAESELSQSSSGNVIQAPPKPTLPFSDLILDGKEYRQAGAEELQSMGVDMNFISSNYIKVSEANMSASGDHLSQVSNDSRVSGKTLEKSDSGVDSDAESKSGAPSMPLSTSIAQLPNPLGNYVMFYRQPSNANGRPASTPLITFDDSSFSISAGQLVSSSGITMPTVASNSNLSDK